MLGSGEAIEFAVEAHALRAAGHILFGEERLDVALHVGFRHKLLATQPAFLVAVFVGKEVVELVFLEFCHRLVEYLLVGFIAEVGDEAALFRSQHIARTTDVEVLHGDVDAAAEVAEVLHRLQTAAGHIVQGSEGWGDKVAECLPVATSHTSTHLVDVGETVVLCAVDDDGVGIGHVDAVLHDGGGEHHVIVVVHEVEDNLLQVLRIHLSMADTHTGIGHVLVYHLLQLLQIADFVVHDEHLPVAAHLEVDGLGKDFGRESVYLGLDGVAVGWGSLDDGEVSCT